MSVLFTRRGMPPAGGNSGGTTVSSVKASELSIGSSVFINYDGKVYEFLVIQQGNPSTYYYDSSCDGTWLMMKKVYASTSGYNYQWSEYGSNNYASSSINSLLDSEFLSLFDEEFQKIIISAKIPYVNGTGSTGSVVTGSDGLSRKLFLLSCYEVGWTQTTNSYIPTDGYRLSYFTGLSETDSKRIGYGDTDDTATAWWLRSPNKNNTNAAWCVSTSGGNVSVDVQEEKGIRFAFIIPGSTLFNSTTMEFIGDGSSSGGETVSGTLGSDLEIGSSVFLKVNGTLKEFLIVHQGLPSSLYDSSCDGTWLLMKDLYENRAWGYPHNSPEYGTSSIHTYLNNTFFGNLDTSVKAAIKQVKIPYVSGPGSNGSVASGSNGLSAQIFLLSGYEVGWTKSANQNFPEDGACLSYFKGTSSQSDSKRIAYLNGTATYWWLRSPDTSGNNVVWRVFPNGGRDCGYRCDYEFGIRPALILPSNALFDPDTKEFVGVGGNSSGSSGSQTNTYTITFSEMENSGTSNTCSITADGTTHTMSTDLVLKVNPGTVITVSSTDSNFTYVNSEYIQSGTSYNYTVNGNINIEYRNMATGRSSMIDIIEL